MGIEANVVKHSMKSLSGITMQKTGYFT